MAAKGEVSLLGDDGEAGGMAVTRSPWLIQTGRALARGQEALEQAARAGRGVISARPNSRSVAGLDLAAELGAHGLLAVADAQHRDAEPRTRPAVRAGSAPHASRRGRRRG